MRHFASDNYAGIHPKILRSLAEANHGHAAAYGQDDYTARATARFRELLGEHVEVSFVFNGTAANVLGLSALAQSFEAIVCSEHAHIHLDECGAPEKHLGSKLIPIATRDGKLSVESVRAACVGTRDQHRVQPKVLAVSQTTELGTLYTAAELRALADFAHSRAMHFHVDGARIANAVAATGSTAREMLTDTGVDVISFGGTKNGLAFGEAVVFLNPELGRDFRFRRKQGMQLASKMRFIACQFETLLSDDLWLQNARHAKAMAQELERALRNARSFKLSRPVAANAVFGTLPAAIAEKVREQFRFYSWDDTGEVRLMTAFDTTSEDIHQFVARLQEFTPAP